MNPYLEKLRSVGVIGVRTDGTDEFRSDREKAMWKDQKYYRQARKEGMQPDGTSLAQSTNAMRISDRLGRAYRADDLHKTYYPEIPKLAQATVDERTGEAHHVPRRLADGRIEVS